ncbi:hypothetical protein BDN70DRAFT_575333 [Pholiota conissans]|uniref:Uncharacterized protein n=1 Tax=Pholiota conissans TaxID=109636 RepID=A0A9P5YKC4_9AGAR|nr:hypothetical protein BDN70DRAFT_575333 [Pholiota conissans]
MPPKRFEQGNPSTRSNMGDGTDRGKSNDGRMRVDAHKHPWAQMRIPRRGSPRKERHCTFCSKRRGTRPCISKLHVQHRRIGVEEEEGVVQAVDKNADVVDSGDEKRVHEGL